MTDAALPGELPEARRSIDLTSDAALARIRQRYRAEARFRLYGMAAIGFAALFLVVLLADIVIKAIPAFTQARLNMEVPVSAELVNPEAPATGDFDAAVREALKGLFPDVKSRAERKALTSVLSSGAANALRSAVIADPALIGQSVKVPVLLSSDSDLYLKGLTARTREVPGSAPATPSAVTGPVTVEVSGGAFAPELALLRDVTAVRVADLQQASQRAASAAAGAAADLKAAETRLAAAKSGGSVTASLEAEASKALEIKISLDKQAAEFAQQADALAKRLEAAQGTETLDTAMPSLLLAINGGMVKVASIAADRIEGEAVVPLSAKETAAAGAWRMLVVETPESSRKIDDRAIAFLEKLKEKGVVETVPNFAFFSAGDSREPEVAGILGALVGSALTMVVTLLLTLPIGVGAAVYLEQFAPKNRFTHFIEVNINNLAAVPSIVFGLLGLAMFLNFFGMPRSSPLVGGLVLALLVLPTIIIASRAALKSVPPSIIEAALGVGASHQQAVFHHVLPVAMPGILTGTIIGMAHALGESAPLLMIGMIAFIVDVPTRVTEAATVLPVQIFLWSDLPELGFQAKTAAAIIVLLLFLFVMNGLAIWMRRKFERRW